MSKLKLLCFELAVAELTVTEIDDLSPCILLQCSATFNSSVITSSETSSTSWACLNTDAEGLWSDMMFSCCWIWNNSFLWATSEYSVDCSLRRRSSISHLPMKHHTMISRAACHWFNTINNIHFTSACCTLLSAVHSYSGLMILNPWIEAPRQHRLCTHNTADLSLLQLQSMVGL